MILPMRDLRQALKGYDFVKTVCLSEHKDLITFTVNEGECDIVAPDIELSYVVDTEGYDSPINLEDFTINTLKKIKEDNPITVTNHSITIGSKLINHDGVAEPPKLHSDEDFELLGTFNGLEVLNAIKSVKHAIGKDTHRQGLLHICWKNNEMVAVDGYRVAMAGITTTISEEVLLTNVAWKFLEKFIDKKGKDLIRILRKDDEIQIIYGDWMLFTKAPKLEFLKYESLFSNDAEIVFKVNRKELVERIEFVSTKANVPMKLTLDDALTMSINGINEVTESMQVDWISKKPLEIAFNPKYVLEALKSSNDEVICIAMNSSLTPMIITFSTGKELVLPIRINND